MKQYYTEFLFYVAFSAIITNVSIFYIDFTLVTFLLIVSVHTYFGNAPNFGQMHLNAFSQMHILDFSFSFLLMKSYTLK
jgi:hypothetical protein